MHGTPPRIPQTAGRARISSTGPSGTELAVNGSGTTVRVGTLPDAARAAAVRRGVDRIVWQQLTAAGTDASGEVYAVTRRRPLRIRVSGSTALGLLESGVPTVVRDETALVQEAPS